MSEVTYITPLERLAKHFRGLPGIGKKSAYRLAFHVLDLSEEEAKDFAEAILCAKKSIRRCKICQNISEEEVCPTCLNQNRDNKTICVVENPRDVGAIERISEYRGVFHVLYGVISPLNGKTPEMLTISPLVARVNELIKIYPPAEIEIILATNPSVEGEATALYISRLLDPFGVKITRLAYGIPVGGDLEYADELTLQKAIDGRTSFS